MVWLGAGWLGEACPGLVCAAGAGCLALASAGLSGTGEFAGFGVSCPEDEPAGEPLAGWDDAGTFEPDLSGDPDPPGAEVELESGVAAGLDASLFFRRGGSSPLLSTPTGTSSALCMVFGASAPCGKYVPVPSHGCALPGLLLCSAPWIVNKPCESPDRSASYTVPDSSAIGIGSAL